VTSHSSINASHSPCLLSTKTQNSQTLFTFKLTIRKMASKDRSLHIMPSQTPAAPLKHWQPESFPCSKTMPPLIHSSVPTVQPQIVHSFVSPMKILSWPFMQQTEEIVTCLAEISVRNRRQMHPMVLRFLYHQFNDKLFWEKVLLRSALNTKEMELSFGLIPIITHSASGMIGLC